MFVNQIAVFLENRKGRLNDFAGVLAEQQIDLVTMSIADTKEFGILRAITSDNARAVQALRDAGFAVSSSDLIGIVVDDKPGGLAEVLRLLDAGGVEIEYLYSHAHTGSNTAIILIKVNDNDKASEVIQQNKIRILE